MMSLTVHKDKGNVITYMPSHDVAVLGCLICCSALFCLGVEFPCSFRQFLFERNHPLIDKSSSFESFNYV